MALMIRDDNRLSRLPFPAKNTRLNVNKRNTVRSDSVFCTSTGFYWPFLRFEIFNVSRGGKKRVKPCKRRVLLSCCQNSHWTWTRDWSAKVITAKKINRLSFSEKQLLMTFPLLVKSLCPLFRPPFMTRMEETSTRKVTRHQMNPIAITRTSWRN